MSLFDPSAHDLKDAQRGEQPDPRESSEPRLLTRRSRDGNGRSATPPAAPEFDDSHRRTLPAWLTPLRLVRGSLILVVLLAVGGTACWFFAQHWVRTAARLSLPQIEGTLAVPGLRAPVVVARDTHGVPHIRASSIDDLLFAQGFVTAGDRLFQMDLLRRHAAGELAEIFGSSMVAHDRLQRTLQIRAAADRAAAALPPDQLHQLEVYARGVHGAG